MCNIHGVCMFVILRLTVANQQFGASFMYPYCSYCRSWQGPLAYGCQDFVVIIDPRTAQNLQTLHGHTATVTRVCLI